MEPSKIAHYQTVMRSLDDADIQTLLATLRRWRENARGTRLDLALLHGDHAMMLLLIHTGITVFELCALNIDDFKTNDIGGPKLMAGVTRRTVPLDDAETIRTLHRWLILRQLAFDEQTHSTHEALFISRRMLRFSSNKPKSLIKRLRQDSGIEFDTFALRHTFIRRKVQLGYSPACISAMLGRMSSKIIQLYGGMNPPRSTLDSLRKRY